MLSEWLKFPGANKTRTEPSTKRCRSHDDIIGGYTLLPTGWLTIPSVNAEDRHNRNSLISNQEKIMSHRFLESETGGRGVKWFMAVCSRSPPVQIPEEEILWKENMYQGEVGVFHVRGRKCYRVLIKYENVWNISTSIILSGGVFETGVSFRCEDFQNAAGYYVNVRWLFINTLLPGN